jgi:hypothetical protein
VSPSAELLAAQRAVGELLQHWDATLAERTLDPRSVHYPWYGRLRTELETLARDHGRCSPEGPPRPHSQRRGSWTLRCERGSIDIELALTPSTQPRVQMLTWSAQLPPDERMARSAALVAAAIGGEAGPIANQLAPVLAASRVARTLAHAALDYGSCSIERPKAGDGRTKGVFLLRCSEAPAELTLELDRDSGLITALQVTPPREPNALCWP